MTIETQTPSETPSATPSDRELLAGYAKTRSDDEFRRLAERHLDWIYSVALRRTHRTALAEEVTQGVLLTLSQKAASLQSHPSLPSWLFRATQYAANNLLRAERRRHQYEREAMPTSTETTDSELLEKLDRAMNRLGAADREALLLRFYQRLPHAAVAAELRISEDAARQRINRAVEKLRKLLGVKSAASLTAALTGSLVVAAPKHLLALSAAPHALSLSQAIHWGFASAKLKWIAICFVALVPIALATAIISATSGSRTTPVASPATAPTTPPETTPPAANYAGVVSYRITAYMEATADRPERVTGVSYYDTDHGTLNTHIFTDTVYTDRNDGTHEYKFRSDSPYIVQKNWGPAEAAARKKVMAQAVQMVLDFYRSKLTAPHPEMDVVINGEKLACWQSDELVPQSRGRIDQNTMYIWLDAHGLPRRTETITDNTLLGTTTKTRSEIDYNPTVPPESWALPQGKEVVVPEEMLAKQFPVDKAIFTHEAAGQIFAMHQVGRDENGTIFLVISTRVKEPLHGPLADLWGHTSLTMFLSGGEGSRSMTLASLEAPGIHVKYVAVAGGGPMTAELNSLEADPQAQGKSEEFPVSLPATIPALAADAFAGQAYDATRLIDGISTADLRVAVRNKKHRWTDVGMSVSEIAREDFQKETAARLVNPNAP